MTITETPLTTAPADRLLWSFNMLMDVKATADETGGTLSAMDAWLTPAANPPAHTHHDADESFVVLDGEIEFFLGDAAGHVARAGDFVFGPRGVPHRFEVRTPVARMLVLTTPGGGERFFAELGERAAAPVLPTPQAPDVAHVVSVAAAHGIEILPPPAP